MTSTEGRTGPHSVLGRAVAIIDAFGPDTPVLSLRDLTARSGLPKATVHRIAGELAAHGLLEKSDGQFRLGWRLSELGGMARRPSLRQSALPCMRDLAAATGEVVELAALDGVGVVVVEALAGRNPVPAPRIDGPVPAHASAAGKAILAFSPPEVVDQVLAAGTPRLTAYTVCGRELVVQQLREVARRGAAVEREEVRAGVSSIACPVLGPERWAVAALAVRGPTARVDLDRLAPAVRTAALALSRQVGTAPA